MNTIQTVLMNMYQTQRETDAYNDDIAIIVSKQIYDEIVKETNEIMVSCRIELDFADKYLGMFFGCRVYGSVAIPQGEYAIGRVFK